MTDKEIKLPFPTPPIWKLLNIEVIEMFRGYGRLVMPFHKKLTQPYGIVHGGAIFSLADSAVAIAIATVVEPKTKFVTVEMKINFLKLVKEGVMEAKARVLKVGRVIPAEAEVFNNDKLVAKAIATSIILDENNRF
ncbi:PaaI family thioesterase [Desulfobacterota bacterium AH_259_B03_O07]|nr:PaaI family thioesterase [Desulfobacterota bacterium AH_259_B03_O07]